MDGVVYWKHYIEDRHPGFTDAAFYEINNEYPADAKLFWESCCTIFQAIKTVRKNVKIKETRINEETRKKQYLSFTKRRK